jgi:biopolymer transport protein ExbD
MAELTYSGKSGRKSSGRPQTPGTDLTAMVDLAFLLITFFILTTTLAKPRAMQVVMPAGADKGPVPQSRTMTICIGNNNQVLWYLGMAENPLTTPKLVNLGRTGLRNDIINTRERIFKESGRALIVIVKPSAHSEYAGLVATLDELNITSVPSYAIARISPKDIDLLKQQKAF